MQLKKIFGKKRRKNKFYLCYQWSVGSSQLINNMLTVFFLEGVKIKILTILLDKVWIKSTLGDCALATEDKFDSQPLFKQE